MGTLAGSRLVSQPLSGLTQCHPPLPPTRASLPRWGFTGLEVQLGGAYVVTSLTALDFTTSEKPSSGP